jgi:hypothetical protein
MTSPRAGCAFPMRSLLVGQASTESRLSDGVIVSQVVERGLYGFGAAGTRLLRSEKMLSAAFGPYAPAPRGDNGGGVHFEQNLWAKRA